MPIYSGVVSVGADDYYWKQSVKYDTSNTLEASQNQIIFTSSYAVAELDMSGLDTGSTNFAITAATLHWYDSAYVKSPKAATYQGYIQMYSGGSVEIGSVYTFTTLPATAWNSHALTQTEWEATIEGNVTSVRFNVQVPLAGQSRVWDIGAYENSTAAYVVVEFTSGATPSTVRRGRAIVIG